MTFEAYQIYGNDGRATKNIQVSAYTTSWSCRVDGNFVLNVYEGVGSTELEIVFFDDEEKTAFGEITFNYFEEGCLRHLTIPVFYTEEKNWLNIFPTEDVFSNSLSNEYKVFTLKSNIPKDEIQVYVPGQENYKYFITDNLKLYLIKTNAIDTKIILHASTTNQGGSITVLEENLTN